MSNPLVAETKDSTEAFSGIALAEGVADTQKAIESGDWAAGVMGAVGTGLDALGMAMDPFGSILAAGVGWLMEHVGPLSDALDGLTGDADEIKAHSETWKNVGEELGKIESEMTELVKADTANWLGEAGDAYRKRAEDTANLIDAAKKAAEGAADGIGTAGEVVGAVRSLVRDIIAELVGHLVSWALQVLCTLGIGMAWVLPQVVAEVAKVAARIADITTKLIKAMKALSPLLSKLTKGFGDASKALNKIKADSGSAPDPKSVKGPASTNSQSTRAKADPQPKPPGTTGGHGTSPQLAYGPDHLTGKTWYGRKVKFTPDQIRTKPLLDSNNNVIGLGYPSQRGDSKSDQAFAGARTRKSDSLYGKNYDPNIKNGRTSQTVTAPWNGKPFYVLAHSDPQGFQVSRRKEYLGGAFHRNQTLNIDGATHGKLVGSNNHFINASGVNSNQPVVYGSCEAGSSSGNAAQTSADSLRQGSGHSGQVFAGSGTVYTSGNKTISELLVEKNKKTGEEGVFKPF